MPRPKRHYAFQTTFLLAWITQLAIGTSPVWSQTMIDTGDLDPAQLPRHGKSMQVRGTVVDANGMAVANAKVAIVASEYARWAKPVGVQMAQYVGGDVLPLAYELFGPVETNSHGNFALEVLGSHSGIYAGLEIQAAAPGHGRATSTLGQVAPLRPIELKLDAEHVVRAKVIDLKGQPAVGVRVRLIEIGWYPTQGQFAHWDQVTSNDKGQVLIRGLGRGTAIVQFEGESFTPRREWMTTVPVSNEEMTTVSLSPGKRIEGRVILGDSGEPAVRARIVSPFQSSSGIWVETRTDAQGRYSIVPFAVDEDRMYMEHGFRLYVLPPTGQLYLTSKIDIPVTRASAQQRDIKLERGVLLRGRVSERDTNTPIALARIQFIPVGKNEDHFAASSTATNTAMTHADGTFELPIPHRRGHLMVLGPTLDYVRVESTEQELYDGRRPGKDRMSADAIIPVDGEAQTAEAPLDIKLRKGVTLRGHVLRPDGQPASDYVVFYASYSVPGYQFSYSGPGNRVECRGSEFEISGCDPDKTHRVHFYDEDNDWGTVVEMTRANQTEPAVVRLEPCGSAEVRCANKDHKPTLGGYLNLLCILVDGAPAARLYSELDNYDVEAIELGRYSISRHRVLGLWREFKREDKPRDENGRAVFFGLIPGAQYTISWPPSREGRASFGVTPYPHLDFTVKAGEVKDLGEILMEEEQKP